MSTQPAESRGPTHTLEVDRSRSRSPPTPTGEEGKAESKDSRDAANSLKYRETPFVADDEGATPLDQSEMWDAPTHVKWFSLAAVIVLPLGVNWTDASLSPLRNTLREELGINNQQFGVITSANSVINSIWPIFGGALLDWFGVDVVAPLCTLFVFIGSIIAAAGVDNGNWRIMVGGKIVSGLGSMLLDSCQNVFFHAIGGRRGLGLPYGIENAIASATGIASAAAAIPIRDRFGTPVVFWVGSALCGISLAINCGYAYYVRRVIPQWRIKSRRDDQKGEQRKLVSFESIWLLPWVFWMLPATQIMQAASGDGYNTGLADIIRLKGYTEAVAGFLESGGRTIRLLLGPIIGYAIDRWGHRFHYVAFAPLAWLIAVPLIGWSDAHPMISLVFNSLALSVQAPANQLCLHLLIADHRLIGTGFGIWRAFNNSGDVIMSTTYGRIVDMDGGDYTRVLSVLLGFKTYMFLAALVYIWVDHRFLRAGLTMTRARRDAVEAKILSEDRPHHPLTSRRVVPWVTYATLGLLSSMIISAWVLFFLGMS